MSVPPLISWKQKTYHTQEAKTEALALRQAMADADWGTVERHGSLDAVVEKIYQAGEETVASAGAAWIDNFRLGGPSRYRQMGRHLSDGG